MSEQGADPNACLKDNPKKKEGDGGKGSSGLCATDNAPVQAS